VTATYCSDAHLGRGRYGAAAAPAESDRKAPRSRSLLSARDGERAILVRIGVGRPAQTPRLEEFTAIANAAGALLLSRVSVAMRPSPNPRYFVAAQGAGVC